MRRLISVFTLAALLVTATVSVSAQTRSRSKGTTPQKTADTSKGSSSENTCDGALDIVPSETLSFQRKRRPPAEKQPTKDSSDKKTER